MPNSKIHTDRSQPGHQVPDRTDPVDVGLAHVRAISGSTFQLVLAGGRVLWVPFSGLHRTSELNRDSEVDAEGRLVLTKAYALERGFAR